MPESHLVFDIETLADRARSLWRAALDQEPNARVELFVKVSLRSKVARDLARTGTTPDHAHESGLAVRVFQAERDHAGFAAASGLSTETVRWAMSMASRFATRAPASAPGPSDDVASERWDLDASAELPTEESLTTSVMSRPSLEWVEAGTTLEVLIGADGWLAARRRHRVWALDGSPAANLVAQRGFAGWELLADRPSTEVSLGACPPSGDLSVIALAPDAAAATVAALVDTFHGASGLGSTIPGLGWEVSDQPVHPLGLAGGSFDDAGFAADARTLATEGFWMGGLGGRGTFWRGSFRKPPRESASNLVMRSDEDSWVPAAASIARRCRVLRPSNELWVIELDLERGLEPGCADRRWIRIQPEELLRACSARLGGARVTPTGPIVPWLLFDGLSTALVKHSPS